MSMDKQKVLDKVTKLLALANNPGANTNEASIALRQARALMAQYNIESDELRAGQVAESSIRTGTRRSPADWLHSLAATCAAAFDCSHLSYYHPLMGYCFKFLGKGIGPELASYAYSSLALQLQKPGVSTFRSRSAANSKPSAVAASSSQKVGSVQWPTRFASLQGSWIQRLKPTSRPI